MKHEYNKQIIERLKSMPKFYLGQLVKTKDGEGVIVELKMEWNGLYVSEERATAVVWFSMQEQSNGWISHSYRLNELIAE